MDSLNVYTKAQIPIDSHVRGALHVIIFPSLDLIVFQLEKLKKSTSCAHNSYKKFYK